MNNVDDGSRVALVVPGTPVVPPDLEESLVAEGFLVHREAGLEACIASWSIAPDLLLASASLGPDQVGRLRHHFVSEQGWPTTLVFLDEDDVDGLEACVDDGFDFLIPPYRAKLLRHKVSSCTERSELVSRMEGLTARAHLQSYERDMNIAHDIQAGFLPERLPQPRGWELASRFRPAQEVGGDFYDAFDVAGGRRVGFVVSDVCDKGVGAALFMALIRTLLRHTAENTGGHGVDRVRDSLGSVFRPRAHGLGPAAAAVPSLGIGAGPLVSAVEATNRYLTRNHGSQGYFATMFFGVLDPATGAVVYINGGHNPPLVVRRSGEIETLAPTGPAVGMAADSTFLLNHISLDPGDVLFAYTDGVSEARSAERGLFGTDRISEIAAQAPERSAEELLDAMDGAISQYTAGAVQSDDITMMGIRHSPTEREATAQ